MTLAARSLLLVVGVLSAGCTILLTAALIQAGQVASVTIDPANQSVSVGSDVAVDILIENLSIAGDPGFEDGLGAFEVALTFRPDLLTFDGFAVGPFLGSTGRPPNCLISLDADDDQEPDPGYVRVGCVTFGPAPAGPNGDGLLGTLTFNTLCSGETVLPFALVALSGTSGVGDVPVNISGGNVTVTGGEPCAAGHPVGDANCNDVVNAIDAALILQHDAGLLATLACPDEADVDGSGGADARDALLVLQFEAGLITQLPP
ncbi:MAG: dockerin type I domain-containing protein [Dehalococcoidia bacterium]